MKKLILLPLLVVPVYADEPCPCPEDRIAKYECGDTWTFAEGEDVVTLSGDCQEVGWGSDTEVSQIIAKAGQECTKYTGGYSGTIVAEEQDLSHFNFCKEGPTAVTVTNPEASYQEGALLWIGLVMLSIMCMVVLNSLYREK